ncbi:MAG TPA: hypothetical protein VJV03_17225 [Pyrinomonadaceae bacterium]|nr:hypothetical protein [Pyrinomonadaceae bacterium]
MTRNRILVLGGLILIIGLVWVLWIRPRQVDMAQFAPAGSLLYLEVNHPVEVVRVLGTTDVGKLLGQIGIVAPLSPSSSVWQKLVRITGVGPVDSVIMARSQVAVVVTNFEAAESGETLNVKPEAAMIVQTHTSENRIRDAFERRLETLVRATYLDPKIEHTTAGGVNFVEWRETHGRGRLIAAFLGSIVIIGNSRKVVDACLAVARRDAPSLRSSLELQNARVSSDAANALVFGYVPSSESPKLISVGIPILFGSAPGNRDFLHLAQNATSKIIGTLTWTSRPIRGGIEDRYSIGLQRDVVDQLRPAFGPARLRSSSGVSTDFYSITEYNLEAPLLAWQTMRSSVSGRLDVLAAVVFNETLRNSLTSYGIHTPESFLSAVESPIKTLRLDEEGQRQLLVASVRDRMKLAHVFNKMRAKGNHAQNGDLSIMENVDGTLGVTLSDSLVVIGHPVDVQNYHRIAASAVDGNKQFSRVDDFVESADRSHVVTLTNDAERVRDSMSAVLKSYHREFPAELNERIAALPFATTQTTLTADGLLRVTRSPLGQFSSIIPILLSNRRTAEAPR